MGKSDKKDAKNSATRAYDVGSNVMNQGVTDTSNRVNQLTTRSDDERRRIDEAFTSIGGKKASDYAAMLSGSGGSSSGGGGGGGDGGDGSPRTEADYVGVWNELMGKTGGFDKDRLAGITSDVAALRDFAKTGGVTDADRSNINRESLLNFERTGGYSDSDISNIRSRSNSAVPAYYQNLTDSLQRRRGANFGNMSPGLDRTAFKLARQGAQQQGETARDTEIGISDAIRQNQMDAGKFLSGQNLQLADLTGRNTLEGYKGASSIDQGTQGLINQSRLGASTSKAQDARSRQAIGASSAAAAAARADANARWAAQMEQQGSMFGASGMLDTYQARPEELIYNQDLLRGYRNDLVDVGQNDVNNRINIGYMPGLTDDIKNVASIGGSVIGMFPGEKKGK